MKEIKSLGMIRQRQAVRRAIRGSDKHLTANEVFEGACQPLPSISFATVSLIGLLKEKGFDRRGYLWRERHTL